jgi:hypothetical protein
MHASLLVINRAKHITAILDGVCLSVQSFQTMVCKSCLLAVVLLLRHKMSYALTLKVCMI